ncbi:hypothetical protein [Mycobacterium shigaense]|uniref:Anti-sigma-M factor RsmA n=1 Tax=Mycobacterium shigaense TaxID=722731 RepID=A0A1Z4EQ28_9MYCO|nr:hypothetical protein [Mycobacterium shigaense]MEA1121507.1 hypothetical protein [Mycobacterium shigaense]PRI15205.1 hypothetical protein B2J96_12375 [Mycobacterium shigaense]BAX95079.1 anti-sigma-M factor RsmA [Mycobacterium shigaense]
MGEVEKPASDPPLTVELLADLQAGLLDDAAAARVRRQVRADPRAQGALRALDRVRRDLAAAGADEAPAVPAEVTARITATLQSATTGPPGGSTHAARPHLPPARLVAAIAGACAALAAVAFGTVALLREPAPTPSTGPTAEHITVSTPPAAIPLSAADLRELLHQPPDFGPLSDPARRASCLSGLGYPASTLVLGGHPVEINARPGIVLVLPADTPDNLTVFAVSLNCSAADTGLLADTQIPRA